MTCRKCVVVLHDIDKFCDKCGTATAVFEKSGKVSGFLCLHCGTALKRTKRYCSACGELAQRKHRRGLLGRVRVGLTRRKRNWLWPSGFSCC